ncbi:hypothetical protein EHS25_005130 [Saitozyma podzolica]|uniref:BTB domain-containing protein n=1 Tax=Saitozyma podzolica TaxID=1890683 RepID=A0A427Y2R7_9TREE|nr:hypothetical protein EHS25_005130 [Saitozyma podzolica]
MSDSAASRSVPAKRQRRESDTPAQEAKVIHENYTHGKLEIISSDGVIFKVDPIYLGQVFRDMIDLSKDAADPIELTDDENEKASIVARFLDALHGKPIIEAGCKLATLLKVIALSDKYDCASLQHHLQQEFHSKLLSKTYSSYHAFIVLCKLGDVEGCAAAIRVGGLGVWTRPTSSPEAPSDNSRALHEVLLKVGWVDPASWPFNDVLKVDLRFYYALIRAFKVAEVTLPLTNPQLEKIAEEFCRLLGKHTAASPS